MVSPTEGDVRQPDPAEELLPAESIALSNEDGSLSNTDAISAVPKAQEALPPVSMDSSPRAVERPGCVTLYAVLAGLGGIFSLIGLVFLALSVTDTNLPILAGSEVVSALVTFGLAIVSLAIAIGLWRMRRWARTLVLIVQGLQFAGNVLTAILVLVGTRDTAELMGSIVGLIIGGIIINWFWKNERLFT